MLHSAMLRLAHAMAIIGGLVLSALIVLTGLSVLGRSLNGFLHGAGEAIAPGLSQTLLDLGIGPINGDFELVEAGVAFAIFAFLPLCQISGGHASVDIFTSRLPPGANRFLSMVIEIVFAAVLVLIADRLFDGMQSKIRNGQTTFLLQFPIWWAYAASFVGAVVAALVGVYMAYVRIAEFFTGRTQIPLGHGADH